MNPPTGNRLYDLLAILAQLYALGVVGDQRELLCDLEEAARVDGASIIQAFLQIILPISGPGIVTSSILAFVFSWNNFMFSVQLATNQTKTVPVAIALGFDKPAPDLMEHRPRPLKQPILSRSQWVRIVIIGILAAIATVYLESVYQGSSAAVAASMGFVAFSFLSVVMGLAARSETKTAFNRDVINDRTQLLLYGIALIMTILSTELGVLQRILGLTHLTRNQWLICIGVAVVLLLIDEVIKFFLRRRRQPKTEESLGRLVSAA